MYTTMLALLFSAPSLAADAEPFSPASSLGSGSGTLQGEAPLLGNAGPSFGVGLSSARDLVVYYHGDGTRDPMLSGVLSTELSAGYTFGSRVRVDASVPLYLEADAPWSGYNGAAAGDARLQATIPILADRGGPFSLAIVPHVGLPTGTQKAFLGRGPSAGATAAVGGDVESVGWVGNLGFVWSAPEAIEGVTMGSTVDALGGAWWNVGDGLRVGGEANLSYGLPSGLTGTRNTFAAGHLFTQATRPNGSGLVVGIGRGLIGGIGAPAYRVFAAFTYARVDRDLDLDGVSDDQDACPVVPEDVDTFEDGDGCPDDDNDADHLVDTADKCPDEAEDADGFEDDDGCRDADNDADGIADLVDQCPLVVGPAGLQGCPDVDTDGDGLNDLADACPTEARAAGEALATSDGCPKRTWLAGTQLVSLDTVSFGEGVALSAGDQDVLDDVVRIMTARPWLLRVEIGVHVDDRGDDAVSLAFSQLRADAIVSYLVQKGVGAERLSAAGYGDVNPIDTNRTDTGRARNRRVVFTVREQKAPTP